MKTTNEEIIRLSKREGELRVKFANAKGTITRNNARIAWEKAVTKLENAMAKR